jgi:hypothetical protein
MTVKERLDNFDNKLDDIKDSLCDIKISLSKYDIELHGSNNDGLIQNFKDFKEKEFKGFKDKEFKEVKDTVDIHSRNFWGLGILSCIFGTIVGFVANIIANRHF